MWIIRQLQDILEKAQLLDATTVTLLSGFSVINEHHKHKHCQEKWHGETLMFPWITCHHICETVKGLNIQRFVSF